MPESPHSQSRSERRAKRHYDAMREKVVQWLKDVWRPYHGSTAHPETEDGNRRAEKQKSGGHMPLNAAAMQLWPASAYRGGKGPTERQDKLISSRDLFARELYRLACGTPEEVAMFGWLQDLFRTYGAGDSDYDFLKKQARMECDAGAAPDPKGLRTSCKCETQLRLAFVEAGIDRITRRLIAAGVTGREFWADFAAPGVLSGRARTAEEEKRRRYLVYQDCRARLQLEMGPDGRPKHKRVTNKAVKMAADECGCSTRSVERAIQDFESGYLDAS